MDDDLADLVRRYRVTWETRSEWAPQGRSVAPIGYVVELNAITDDADHAETIASPDCHVVEDALQRLTGAIAHSEVVHVGRGTRQLGTGHDARPEVSATVTIMHRDAGSSNRPPENDERSRLAEIVNRLRELGAQERHWHDDEVLAETDGAAERSRP